MTNDEIVNDGSIISILIDHENGQDSLITNKIFAVIRSKLEKHFLKTNKAFPKEVSNSKPSFDHTYPSTKRPLSQKLVTDTR